MRPWPTRESEMRPCRDFGRLLTCRVVHGLCSLLLLCSAVGPHSTSAVLVLVNSLLFQNHCGLSAHSLLLPHDKDSRQERGGAGLRRDREPAVRRALHR